MRVMAEEEEIGLPRAGLNKLIKDTLPNIRVANESRDVVYNCCLDFIKVIAAEANNLCNQEQRKTISHEHVLKAIENLGFGPEYVTASASVLDNCREQAAKRLKRQGSRLERLGIPEEELLRQQQELIEKARHEQAAEEQTQMALFHQMMAEHNESLLVSESGTSNSSAATAVEGSSNSTSNGVQQQPQLQQLFDLSLLNGQSNSKLSKLSDELDEDYDID